VSGSKAGFQHGFGRIVGRMTGTIERYGEGTKYKVVFSEPAKPIGPVPRGDAPPGMMQGPRFTTYAKLIMAKKLSDLLGKA